MDGEWAQKDGCAQRTGAHARAKPTSLTIPSVLSFSAQLRSTRVERRVEVPLFLTNTVYVKDDVKSWNDKKDLLL